MFRRFFLRPLGWLLAVLLVIVVIAVGSGLGFRSWKQSEIRSATRIDTPNGIESLELVTLNGSKQWIYLRGHDKANPVLLFLHGGPGTPEMALARQFGLEVEKHFTVVHWDQRGSGKSRGEGFAEADLTIQTFLDDTLALVNLLRQRFDDDKIYLVGHSWGTVLGTLTVRDHAELFHAYVGMGQVVNMVENERVSLDFALEAARADGNVEAVAQLESLNPPYSADPSELFVQRKWLHRYGGGMRGLTQGQLLYYVLTSPEYSLRDGIALGVGSMALAKHMWPEMSGIDFFTQATSLEVPVYFFTGRYDYNTPFELTQQYFDVLDAPYKEMVWFENSSHFMNVSDPDHYQDMLINTVLAETAGD